ncbi:MAG: four helix bundle protein [bacterium]|nr:four helix bundle protein [bacterium]
MSKFERFEDIESWKKARELNKKIYELTNTERFNKDFGFKDQIRRASLSISSNIAEGFERGGDKEFFQCLSIAKGSCGEVRSQLYLAYDIKYVSKEEAEMLLEEASEISKMINGLMKYLRSSEFTGKKYK